MTTETIPKFRDVQELNVWLADQHMRGQWVSAGSREPSDPKPFGAPHIWKGNVIREGLNAAVELVQLGNDDSRRTSVLVHPELTASATPTISMAVQLVMPGETAMAHRHTATAIRFIVEGDVEAYTVADGEKCVMERGDLILTPNWSWHEHHNNADQPVVWIDGLDAPLVRALHAGFAEPYPTVEGIQPLISEVDNSIRRPGDVVPPGSLLASRLVYKWRNTDGALRAMQASEKSPFDSRLLEYPNTTYGGSHTSPTLSCWIQLIEPKEKTKSHRHTYNHVYYGFEGSGSVELEDRVLAWEKGDGFVVPNWTWHRHHNESDDVAAILFSMNDVPILEAAGLLREEVANE